MTVRYQGPELIVDTIVAKLRSNMPQRAAAINAERADNILIEPPGDNDYYTASPRAIGRAPAILVLEGRTTLQRGQEGPHELLTTGLFAVYILEEDADEQRLGRKLQRQSAAIIESLWDSPPLEQLANADGTVAFRITPMESVPGPAFEYDGGVGTSWREFYLWIFQVQRIES